MQNYYYGTTTKENIKIGDEATTPIFYNAQDGFTVTKSVLSAMYFAGRKVEKFGGLPIVYYVEPIDDIKFLKNNEFLCTSLHILDEVRDFAV